ILLRHRPTLSPRDSRGVGGSTTRSARSRLDDPMAALSIHVRLAAIASLALAPLSCTENVDLVSSSGSGGPSSVSQQVGPDGAVITFGDLTLTIPAGALDHEVTIAIAIDSAGAPLGYEADSPVYRFGPDGLIFAKSASLSARFSGGGSHVAVYWSQPTGAG